MYSLPFTAIKIASYNCKNVKTSLTDISKLCEDHDVILLQETWLFEHDLCILSKMSNDFYAKGISSMNSNDGLILGRPHGGLCVMWKKTLGNSCKPISYKDESRIMALELKCGQESVLILNMYMPYCCADNRDEYVEYLSRMNHLIETADTNFVLAIGDFNADVSSHQLFGRELKMFVEEERLVLSDLNHLPLDTFTFFSDAHSTTSWLDHVVASKSAANLIENVMVRYDCISSDHLPLSISLSLPDVIHLPTDRFEECSNKSMHVKWNAMSQDDLLNYTSKTEYHLAQVTFDHRLALCDVSKC